jgi:hypothetical protein
MQGRTKNRPGPFPLRDVIFPSRRITARSYSFTIWIEETKNAEKKIIQTLWIYKGLTFTVLIREKGKKIMTRMNEKTAKMVPATPKPSTSSSTADKATLTVGTNFAAGLTLVRRCCMDSSRLIFAHLNFQTSFCSHYSINHTQLATVVYFRILFY